MLPGDQQLQTIPDDCPAWLAHFIGVTNTELKGVKNHLGQIDGKLDTLLSNSGTKSKLPEVVSNVTFKWLLEKVALPLLLGGGSAAIAVYAVMRAAGG